MDYTFLQNAIKKTGQTLVSSELEKASAVLPCNALSKPVIKHIYENISYDLVSQIFCLTETCIARLRYYYSSLLVNYLEFQNF